MSDKRSKRAKINIVVSLLCQLISIICGLIVPRALMKAFGSEVYGACASITQFLAYIALLEGGISGVARAALYKPLAENDITKISQIVQQIQKFFRIIGFIFIGYVVILAIFFKNIAHLDNYEWLFTASLVIVISISTLAQYLIGISYAVLIQAAQRIYITYIVTIVTTIINAVLVIILIKMQCNIVVVKLISSCVFALRPILLSLYVKKEFKLIRCPQSGEDMLKQRWTGLGQHIAYFLHSNTDIAILTLFVDLKHVAIYSVYHLVVSNVQNLSTSFATGMEAVFGDMLAKREVKKLEDAFSLYETLISMVSIVFFGTTITLIIPFVRLYTRNITDANYIRPLFAIILSIASFLYCLRQPYHSMIIAAGQFKQTRVAAYGEAIINIFLSIILVSFYDGLIGVAIGTAVAVMFRLLYYVIFLSKNIINRKFILFLKRSCINIICIVISILVGSIICNYLGIESYYKWFICACITAGESIIITSAINAVFYKKDFVGIIKRIKIR